MTKIIPPAPALSLTDTLRQRDAQIQRLKDSLLDEMKGRQDAIEEAAGLRRLLDEAMKENAVLDGHVITVDQVNWEMLSAVHRARQSRKRLVRWIHAKRGVVP